MTQTERGDYWKEKYTHATFEIERLKKALTDAHRGIVKTVNVSDFEETVFGGRHLHIVRRSGLVLARLKNIVGDYCNAMPEHDKVLYLVLARSVCIDQCIGVDWIVIGPSGAMSGERLVPVAIIPKLEEALEDARVELGEIGI
jgi:hypothetical protein